MKYIKIIPEDHTDLEVLKNTLNQIKGIHKVELIDEENPESELKKAFHKSKEQLKKGEYESIVNDIFDLLIQPKSK